MNKKSSGNFARGIDKMRRRLFALAAAGAGAAAVGSGRFAVAQEASDGDELRFPGDPPEHKIVFQFNKADEDYQNHVLFSVGAVLRKYGDNVKIVVVSFAQGIHILAKNPLRPVSEEIRQRVSSLAQYGVEFHACGNTMKSLSWTEEDLVPFAKVVEVGAADLMELQEEGFAYVAW